MGEYLISKVATLFKMSSFQQKIMSHAKTNKHTKNPRKYGHIEEQKYLIETGPERPRCY